MSDEEYVEAQVYICMAGEIVAYVGFTTTGMDYRWSGHRHGSSWHEFITDIYLLNCARPEFRDQVARRPPRPADWSYAGMSRNARRELIADREEELVGAAMDGSMAKFRAAGIAAGLIPDIYAEPAA